MEKEGKFGVICINPIPNPQSPIHNPQSPIHLPVTCKKFSPNLFLFFLN